MTEWQAQTIETLDLIRAPISCFICDGQNRCDADLCSHCGAPLALAFTDEARCPDRHFVAVLGTPAAGKTVYLGMLTDILSRQRDPLQVLARGAFSVSLQQQTMAALSRRRYPDRTPLAPEQWNWVHCEVNSKRAKKRFELVLPDLAGSAFVDELEPGETLPAVRGLLTKCSAALLIVDAEQIECGDQEQDFITMKLVTYLSNLVPDRKTGWRTRPVAVVFTKAEANELCLEDPEQYAQERSRGLFRLCHERLKRHQFFATSVVGNSATVSWQGKRVAVPLRIEPRGILEPFKWIVRQFGAV